MLDLASYEGQTVKLTNRMSPCRCGCNGTDPWHQATYERVLRNVQPATGTVMVKGHPASWDIRGTAEVKLPWGIARAVLVQVLGHDLGWYVEA